MSAMNAAKSMFRLGPLDSDVLWSQRRPSSRWLRAELVKHSAVGLHQANQVF
jgi:hypothetical protein